LSSTDWTTSNNKQPALNGTGFVKISGTTISYDNSTYLTTAAAASTYLPLAGGTLTGALVGTSSSFSGNLTVSTGNATGGGIILADDGDIVDLNDAFLSLRFSSGVRVFSANRGGSPVITLANTGDISANGNITGANLSGINTGDQTLSSLGGVPTSRTITINGTTQDLSDNRIYNVGTVTSVASLTLGTSGTDLSSSVANGTTTPVITLNVPTASVSNRGALSAADWTTFNNKIAGSGTANSLAKFTAGGTVGNSGIFENGGNVGIGTSAPDGRLKVVGSSGAQIIIDLNGNNENYFDADTQIFRRYGGGGFPESMRITSGGNVGIGTTSPIDSNRLTVLMDGATNGTGIAIKAVNDGAGGSQPALSFWNGSGNLISKIVGDNGTGYIAFNMGSSDTERMRISSAGNILINTTNDTGAYKLDVNGSGRFTSNIRTEIGLLIGGVGQLVVAGGSTFLDYVGSLNIRRDFGALTALTLTSTGAATFSSSVTATAFFTSSDKRKKDIISQDGDLATYRFKGDDQIHYGYIAQDMEALYPNQVSTDNDGMLSLNYIEILVKKVHDLETKLKKHGLD
jgi:hypothetical protein